MGALQGIGTPAAYAAQPTPWGSPWGHPIYSASFPYAHSFTPQQPGAPLSGYPGTTALGGYAQQQLLHSLHAAIQQVQQVVPLQLQQIQQLLQLLALQSHTHTQGLQPVQMPFIGGPSGWFAGTQAGQPQMFSGQPGYVM